MRTTITTLLIIFFSIHSVLACSCAEIKGSLNKKVKSEISRSDIIFTGKIISESIIVSTHVPRSTADPVFYKFEITEIYKGNISSKTIEIATAEGGSSCGYPFQVGKTYLVYASSSDHYKQISENQMDFVTDLCTRNNEINYVAKGELNKLRRFRKRKKNII